MKMVNVHEAQAHFFGLIADVQDGAEIVITEPGKPVATLSRIGPTIAQRVLGQDAGLDFWIADDFDEYVPEEFVAHSG